MLSFRRFVLVALTAACGVGCTASPASAARGFGLSFSFNAPESGFNTALASAVDQSDGDVYVADLGNYLVWKFKVNLEGKSAQAEEAFGTAGHLEVPVEPFQPAVNGEGDLFVPTIGSGTVPRFSSLGEPLALEHPIEALTQPVGVGTDSSGNIYVAELGGAVRKFNKLGKPVNALGVETPANILATAPSRVRAFAVDPTGERLYLASEGGAVQYTLTAGAYVQTATLDEGAFTTGVAIAPTVPASSSAGNVFVESGGEILEYTSAGVFLTRFGAGKLSGGAARLSVYGTASGTVVYAPNFGEVDVFTEGETPEAPTTEPATEVTGTTAELHGKLNPAGKAGPLDYSFTYGSAGKCEGGETSTEEIGEAKEASVKAEAAGLSPETEYTYCLVAKNTFGSAPGSPQTFKTGAGPPRIDGSSVVETTQTGAQLEASINPQGAATTCTLEYGPALEKQAPCSPEELPAGVEDKPVKAELSGLEPATTYKFRFKAANEKGEVTSEGELTTKPLATAETKPVSAIGAEAVTLNGIVTLATADPTNYFFEYEVEEGGVFVKSAPVAVSGEGAHEVSARVTGLTPDLLYHVRLVAEVVGHLPLAEGSLLEFTTNFLVPVASVEAAKSVTATTVRLPGSVNPNRSETWYSFEYEYSSGGEAHVSRTPLEALPFEGEPGTTPVAVEPAEIRELRPGTTYRYRLLATNTGGTGTSAYGEFTTLALQPPAIESESGQATSQTTATIAATVNPNGLPTTYTLETGPDTSYGTRLSGDVPEDGALSFALTGLSPGTVYHFRVLAQNSYGPATGTDATFTTPGFPQTLAPPASVTILAFTAPPAERTGGGNSGPKHPTRAQLLAKALKACSRKPKPRRAACRRAAVKRYGPVRKRKK